MFEKNKVIQSRNNKIIADIPDDTTGTAKKISLDDRIINININKIKEIV